MRSRNVLISLVCILLAGIFMNCSNPVSDGLPMADTVTIFSVYYSNSPVNDAEVHLVDANNERITTLKTNAEGKVLMPSGISKEDIDRIYVYKQGFHIFKTDSPADIIPSDKKANVTINLSPYNGLKHFLRFYIGEEKSIPLRYSDIAILYDGYPVIKFSAGADAGIDLNTDFDPEKNEILFIVPSIAPGQVADPVISSGSDYLIYAYGVDMPTLRVLQFVPLYHHSSIIPGSYTIRPSVGDIFQITSSGHVYVPFNPGDQIQLTIEGDQIEVHTYDLGQYFDKVYANQVVLLPVKLASLNYSPFFDVNVGSMWVFDVSDWVTTNPHPTGITYSYNLTWNFQQIEIATNYRVYTIEEKMEGRRIRYLSGSVVENQEISNEGIVRIMENEFGFWSYLENTSHSPSLISIGNQIISDGRLFLTLGVDGERRNIMYGPFGRMLPTGVNSLEYKSESTLSNVRYVFNTAGYSSNTSRSGTSHTYSGKSVTRVYEE